MTKLLSVLIPTIESRKNSFEVLRQKLQDQIQRHALEAEVEVLSVRDRGEVSIGFKRNVLLDQASGTFVVFIDDDDNVSDQYLPLITGVIRRHPEIDCIGLKGEVTFRGSRPHPLVYSLRNREFRTERGVYLRPPQHITPIRRDIALRYRFADTSYSEDYDWALTMREEAALRTEYFIDHVLYYYAARRSWWYQWLLDKTQNVRHALGLQLVNRLRLRRRLAARRLG